MPASFRGVYGHQPSETALPPERPVPVFQSSPTLCRGWVCRGRSRGAEDLELALDALAGPEGRAEVGGRLVIPPAGRTRLREYRVAVLPPIDWVPADVEILDAQEKPQVWLGQAGARVKAAQRESLSIDGTKGAV